jgi:hypothetical protein
MKTKTKRVRAAAVLYLLIDCFCLSPYPTFFTNTLYAKPLPKGLSDSGTKEDEDEEVEEEYKNNDNIMAPKNKKSPVKVPTSTTPKKKKPMDVLAEAVRDLSVGRKMWSFKFNDTFFLRGPFTETKGPYVTNYCELDIYVRMTMPQENLLFALSPDGNHMS